MNKLVAVLVKEMQMIRVFSAFAIMFVWGVISPAMAQQSVARFQCDAGAAYTCYFTIYFGGGAHGIKNFTMRGGTGDNISGLDFAHDIYCICINRQAPGYPNQCSSTPGCYPPRAIHPVND